MENHIILSVQDLDVKFTLRGQTLHAIRGVSLDVYEGESLAIVGESGSGKTTLSKMLLGLISVTEGEIDFQGKPRDISNGKKKKEYLKLK